jgi:CheY-like chemotaxis protein
MNQENKPCLYRKVMVIDDSQIDRYVASYNIKRYAFAEEIIELESAKAALEYIKASLEQPENLPELIFLDIRMPEMDGFQFLEEYEKLPSMVQTKCIIMMLSSSLDYADHVKALQNKFVNRFLNKPLDKERLGMLTSVMLH